MIRPKSIHWSLQFWHMIMACVCIPCTIILAHHIYTQSILRKADHELSMELNTVLEQWVALPRRTAHQKYPKTSHEDTWFICWGTKGNYFAKSENAPAIPYPEGLSQSPFYTQSKGYRILYHFGPRKNTIYAVGIPYAPIEKQLNNGLMLFIAGGVVVAITAIVGGYFSNLRALKPLEDINKKATLISNGHYEQRIDSSQAKSELIGLCLILNKAFDHIDSTLEIQRQFTSNASHEIRTPISILLLELESIIGNDNLSKDELDNRLQHCVETAQKMEHLANSMLKIARLESGETSLRIVETRLDVFLKSSLQSLKPIVEKKSIELSYELPSVSAKVDSNALAQVMTNIISNAASHTQKGGSISVSIESVNDHALIVVSDTGSGIPAADLPHIFDRFYRADKARSADENRSGLGLAICQSIIHAHGGEINIASTEGEGTKVSIQLPS